MKETHIIMKDGQEFSGGLRQFHPEEGWFSILNHFGEEQLILFSEVYSAVTPASRVAFGVTLDRDELRRAAEELGERRRKGLLGFSEEPEEWEVEALK